MRYFAYGSNMDRTQLESRVGPAEFVGVGCIKDYKFLINTRGVATIVPRAVSNVYGIVWELNDKQIAEMDGFEGVGAGHYQRVVLPVQIGNIQDRCSTYIASITAIGQSRHNYIDRIIPWARQDGFARALCGGAMYLDQPIAQFVQRWWEKCRRDTDPFDQFVSGWIVLLTIARADENCRSGKSDIPELDLVENLFKSNVPIVLTELNRCRASLIRLANRQGSDYGNAVLDEKVRERRDSNFDFARTIRTNAPLARRHVLAMAGILYRVRNNLFHGRKIYDEDQDKELLSAISPSLIGILTRFLEQIGPVSASQTIDKGTS